MFDKIQMDFQNSEIHKADLGRFRKEIEPDLKRGKEINVFFSLTHINPTYLTLIRLNELRKIAELGNVRVFVVMWDMNARVNPYFRRQHETGKIKEPSEFVDKKFLELKNILYSLGFDREKVYLYKSSDLWKRLISYKEEDLFQEFYLVLAKMKAKNFDNHKISHIIQNSLDLFFCNYLHRLYPEDTEREIDLAIFGTEKEKIYSASREIMHSTGLTKEKPLFLRIKDFPYIEHDLSIPHWHHNLKSIENMVANSSLSKEEIFQLFKFLVTEDNKIKIKEDKKVNELDYEEFLNEYKNENKEKLSNLICENLFSYLAKHKKKYLEVSNEVEEEILNITKGEELKNIGNILRSDIALRILFLADGTKTITQISKELDKAVPTISIYATRLKKMNLLRMLEGGKLKRNIKALKINLSQGG